MTAHDELGATKLDLRAASLATQVIAVTGGTLLPLHGHSARGSVNILDPRVDIWTCEARPAPHTSNDTTEEDHAHAEPGCARPNARPSGGARGKF